MLTELSALLDMLKAKGVKRFEGCYGEKSRLVKLSFAAPVETIPESEDAKPQDMCKCGHALAEHQGGLCMHACDEEKCT